MLYIFVTVR